MNSVWWTQVLGLFKREARRFLRVPYQTLFSPIVTTILYLLIFGISLGHYIDMPGYPNYTYFIIPGLICLGSVRNAFDNVTSSVIASKYVNELHELRVAPLSRVQILIGYISAATLRGVIVGLITYIASAAFVFIFNGELLYPKHPFITLAYILLGCVIFSALGLLIAFKASSFEKVNIFGTFIMTPLFYLGGIFFSINNLDPVWRSIAKCNPLYYIIAGTRFAFNGLASDSLLNTFVTLICVMIITFTIAYRTLGPGKNFFRG